MSASVLFYKTHLFDETIAKIDDVSSVNGSNQQQFFENNEVFKESCRNLGPSAFDFYKFPDNKRDAVAF